jgi:hypothetical protein
MKKHFLISLITTILVILVFSFLFTACKEKNSPSDPTSPTNTTTTETTDYNYNTFIEPCLDWGKSYQWVSNIMTNKGFIVNQVSPSSSGKFVLMLYYPREKETYTLLAFDTNNKYLYAMIYLDTSEKLTTELGYFLLERYNFIGKIQHNGRDEFFYRTKDGKTDVELYLEDVNGKYYWVVCYSAIS